MTENKIPYEEGWIILDKKQYWFMKRSAADVDIAIFLDIIQETPLIDCHPFLWQQGTV